MGLFAVPSPALNFVYDVAKVVNRFIFKHSSWKLPLKDSIFIW